MHSRQRILAAAERRPADRVPTSLRLTPEALEQLRQYLAVEPCDNTLHRVLDVLDIDLRMVAPPFIGPAERSTPTLFGEGKDFWGVGFTRIETPTNAYFEFTYHPLAEAQCVADVENYAWPELDWWDYAAMGREIEKACQTGERAIMYFAGGAFESPWYLRGLEQFLIDLYTQPEMVAAICEKVAEFYYQRALRVLDAAGSRIDIVGSGGDIGEQQRMLLAPAVWRDQIKPYSARLIRPFKERGLKTFYHTDGSVVPVIDDLIEIGLDILDPVQVSAAEMDPENLVSRFGQRLTFHGAIDEQQVLPHQTASQVGQVTREMIATLGRHHGYIVSPTHMVQGDTPAENVVAVFDAAKASSRTTTTNQLRSNFEGLASGS